MEGIGNTTKDCNSNDLVLVHQHFFWEPGPIIPLCRFSVGQNLAIGYGEWLHVVQAWFDEQANFTYGNKASNVFEDVGHYTQVCVRGAGQLGCSPTFSSVGQKASSVGAEVTNVSFIDFISFGNYIYVYHYFFVMHQPDHLRCQSFNQASTIHIIYKSITWMTTFHKILTYWN